MLPSRPALLIIAVGLTRDFGRGGRTFLRFVPGLPLAGLAFASLFAQTSPAPSTDTQTHLVRGQVVNALDGSPLSRALVTVNTRRALTDYQGRFEFAGLVGANAFATVRKPGFSGGPDASTLNPTQRLTDLDAPVLIKLYPDAVVSGTVTSREGAPLSHVAVRLLRSQYDGVALHWAPTASGQTNSRGEYRISTPGGRFRVASSFVPRSFETGEVVLPASFPEASQGNTSSLVELRSGEERRVDLSAKVGPAYPVTLHVEPANSQHMNAAIIVSTSAGDEFLTGLSPDQHLELPVGSYALNVRVNSREDSMSGTSRVTVTSRDPAAATVHLSLDTQLSVEIVAGNVAAASQSYNSNSSSNLPEIPNAAMFNLLLHNQLANGETQEQDIRPRQEANKITSFRVPPGRYRLLAAGGGQWHVESASLGATDLLLNDLVIGPGSAGGALRVVVSNQTGTVHARTNLPLGTSAWMYLLPRGPSLIPIHPTLVTSNGTATAIATASVPPGTYTAFLLGTQLQKDPRDPSFLASFASGLTDIEVQPGADTSFSFDLAKRKETDQ